MDRSTVCLLLLLAASSLAFTGVAGMALFGPMTFGAGDNGKNVTVNTGDTFWIKLPENPTTGFAWNLSFSDGLTLLQDKYDPGDTSGMKVGVGGTHSWSLKAAKKGLQTISGVYRRPWEPASGGKENFSLNVNVAEGGPLSGLLRLPLPVLDNRAPELSEQPGSTVKMIIRPGENISYMPTRPPAMAMPEFPIMQTGTSVPPLDADRNQRAPQNIQLSYTDVPPADTVSAAVGDTIHLSLPANPSTGYSWQMTVSDGIEPVSDNFVQEGGGWPGRQVVGAGGMQEYVYKLTKPGAQTISGTYKRPWEGSSQGEKTYSLTINAI